jgi:hypothetical protein
MPSTSLETVPAESVNSQSYTYLPAAILFVAFADKESATTPVAAVIETVNAV